jgi:hypothetical protein
MGTHVGRTNRGTATTRFTKRPGDDTRPSRRRPGTGGASGQSRKGPKTGGSPGTRGDFGADFE